VAVLTNIPEKARAIAVNNYGKGRAIYVVVPAQASASAPLVRSPDSELGHRRAYEDPLEFTRVVEEELCT